MIMVKDLLTFEYLNISILLAGSFKELMRQALGDFLYIRVCKDDVSNCFSGFREHHVEGFQRDLDRSLIF